MNSPLFVTIAGLVTTSTSVILAVQALYRRWSRASVPFAALMFATAFWTATYTWEVTSGSLAAATLGLQVEYVPVCLVPMFWYWLSRSLAAGPGRPAVSRRAWFVLAPVPIFTVFLMATNGLHSLVYTSLHLAPDSSLSVIVGTRGPWYWIHVVYSYSLMVLGTFFFVKQAVGSEGRLRGQAIMLLTAAVLPWTGHVLLLFRATPEGMDLTPFLFALSGMVITVALFRFRLFDLVPVARDQVFDAIRDAVVVLDDQSRIVDFNQAASAAFDDLGGASIGTPATLWFGAHGWELPARGEAELCHGTAAPRFYHLTVVELGGTTPRGGRVLLFGDVTETKQLFEQMRRLASTDTLTGLDNRRMFFDHATREVDRARRQERPLSFAILDVDLFKSINDRFGHASGDEALVELAQLFRQNLRTRDLVCRYGGEEFTMIFPDTPPREALDIAERIRQAASELLFGEGERRFRLTVSMGIAGTEGEACPGVEELVHAADMALYRAKARGRNRVVLAQEGALTPAIR